MKAYYNSREEFYKSPFGAVKVGTEVTFRIKVWDAIKGLKVFILMWQDDTKLPLLEMERDVENDGEDYIVYKTKIKAPNEGSIIWYHFSLESFDEKFYYSDNDKQFGGEGVFTEYSPKSYQLTVFKNDKLASWFGSGIIYQIFPDRFFRGSDFEDRKKLFLEKFKDVEAKKLVDNWNETPYYIKNEDGSVKQFDFFGGTLKGIEEKLPYIKSLGVNIIYLNPIFEARSNHRYDTGDYMKIDILLGDENDFDSLVEKASKLDIKIILDGVFSHQGADSKYFNKYGTYDTIGAYNSKDSEYYPWYRFIDFPDNYESWWGVKDLPNTDEMNKTYLDYICKNEDSVIKHWMKKGIGGYRLDVADEIPDEFIKEIRNAMNVIDKKNVLIGEVWEDASNKISYDKRRKYFLNASLNSVINYPFMNKAIQFMKGYISSNDLYEFFYHQMENYPEQYFYTNVNLLDSHDRVRIITELADSPNVSSLSEDEKHYYTIMNDKYFLAISRLKALIVLQFLIPGVPLIYYGDEAGVYGYTDPYNRKTYPWGNENKDLIEHYKQIAKIRNKEKAILNGDFKPIIRLNHTFGFERNYKNEKIIVLINRGIFYNEGEHIDIKIPTDNAVELITGEKIIANNNNLNIDILPLGYKVIKVSMK